MRVEPCVSLPRFSWRRNGVSGEPSSWQTALSGVKPPNSGKLVVVQRRRRAVDDAVVRAIDGDEPAHDAPRLVLPHPLARDDHAQAVADDVHLARAGVGHHRVHEAAQVVDVGGGGMGEGGAAGVVGRQVALGALVAQAPQLARAVAAVREVLREPLDVALERLAGADGERHVVVAVQQDHRRANDVACGAEADHRLAQRRIDDHGEIGRQRGADGAGSARAPA